MFQERSKNLPFDTLPYSITKLYSLRQILFPFLERERDIWYRPTYATSGILLCSLKHLLHGRNVVHFCSSCIKLYNDIKNLNHLINSQP